MTLLHKGGHKSKKELKNYRLIALANTVGKKPAIRRSTKTSQRVLKNILNFELRDMIWGMGWRNGDSAKVVGSFVGRSRLVWVVENSRAAPVGRHTVLKNRHLAVCCKDCGLLERIGRGCLVRGGEEQTSGDRRMCSGQEIAGNVGEAYGIEEQTDSYGG